VERREFGDQLRNSHTEFGRSHLEYIRRVLVDLDADIGTPGTRIADPETVSDAACSWPPNVVRFQPAIRASGDCKLVKARGEMLVSRAAFAPPFRGAFGALGGQPSLACQP
jgi:hypothetical protein